MPRGAPATADLTARVLLPSQGPIPTDAGAAFATAMRRAQRLVDDPDGAVWYGARRVFAFALMIRGGIPTDEVEDYCTSATGTSTPPRLLRRTVEGLAGEHVDSMLRSGAVVVHDGRLHAAADHAPIGPRTLQVPDPRHWPQPEPEMPSVERQ